MSIPTPHIDAPEGAFTREWDINGENAVLTIVKA